MSPTRFQRLRVGAIERFLKDKCPNCSGKVSEVDVIEEIIEFAE
jgi:hypothetical protein